MNYMNKVLKNALSMALLLSVLPVYSMERKSILKSQKSR